MRDFRSMWTLLLREKRVRWMPGMTGRFPGYNATATRLPVPEGVGGISPWYVFGYMPSTAEHYIFPDPYDAATVGCLVAMVRVAWNDPALTTVCDGVGAWRTTRYYRGQKYMATEAEAALATIAGDPRGLPPNETDPNIAHS